MRGQGDIAVYTTGYVVERDKLGFVRGQAALMAAVVHVDPFPPDNQPVPEGPPPLSRSGVGGAGAEGGGGRGRGALGARPLQACQGSLLRVHPPLLTRARLFAPRSRCHVRCRYRHALRVVPPHLFSVPGGGPFVYFYRRSPQPNP